MHRFPQSRRINIEFESARGFPSAFACLLQLGACVAAPRKPSVLWVESIALRFVVKKPYLGDCFALMPSSMVNLCDLGEVGHLGCVGCL